MKYKKRFLIFLVVLTGTVTLSGCGKKGIPGLVRCEGVVQWESEPVEGAHIAFIPKDNSIGRGAFALTNSAGKFKTTTLDANDGILPGEYFVTITKKITKRGGVATPEENDPLADRDGKRGAGPPKYEEFTETYFLPQVYSSKETSGITVVITAKGKKDLKFELEGEID